MEEEDECDSDNEVDMPPILPRVVNADEIGRIITQDYLADGLPEEFIKERLCWDRMSRPLLDGGEGEPKPATVQLKTHCHSIAAGQGPRVPVPQTGVTSRSPQRVQLGKSSSSKGFESPAATAVERESSWIGTPAVQTMNPLCGSPGESQVKPLGQSGTPAVQTMTPLCGLPGESQVKSPATASRSVNQRMRKKAKAARWQNKKKNVKNSGLCPPKLSSDEAVTGKTKDKLRK